MKAHVFIANRLSGKDKENLSGPIIKVAIAAVALGLSVMIIAVAVLAGFQHEIRRKVTGFSAHIRVINFDENESFESKPISLHQDFFPAIESENNIRHIQPFALKAGIIKTEDQMQGIVLKGIDSRFDWDFIQSVMIEGSIISFGDSSASNQAVISRYLQDKLNLEIGDEVRMYFVTGQETQPRGRKFEICGIYDTGMEEIDQVFVIGDLRHIQKLNGWTPDEISGFEIFIDDFNRLEESGELVYSKTGYHLNTETVRQAYPQIFDWLRLMDMNVVIILVLMVVVSAITMVSTLLILILERTGMIGVLKAIGMKNAGIRKIFLLNGAYILGWGMLWGNLAGIGLCLLQHYFRIIPLDQASYYMNHVPADLNWSSLLAINAGTFLLCLIILLIPGMIISRVHPVNAIRFD